jgi:hypothetical protein
MLMHQMRIYKFSEYSTLEIIPLWVMVFMFECQGVKVSLNVEGSNSLWCFDVSFEFYSVHAKGCYTKSTPYILKLYVPIAKKKKKKKKKKQTKKKKNKKKTKKNQN